MKIKLVLSDLDGCINSYVGAPFDLEKISRLKKVLSNRKLPFTFCTGRPKPYLEAVLQMMDIKLAAISENGGIIFDPATLWTIFTRPEARDVLERATVIVREKVIKGLAAFFEPSKQTTIGILPNDIKDTKTTEELCKRIAGEEYLAKNFAYNIASNVVNLLPNGVSKKNGVAALLDKLGVDKENVLAIGDSSGDIEFMQYCKYRACPANSTEDVKKICGYVSKGEDIEGMMDILENLEY